MSTIHWVEIPLELTAKEVRNIFGPACEEYDPDCLVCHAWECFEDGLPVQLLVERGRFLAAYTRGDL